MMHHPSGVARGQASDIFNEARELMRVRNYVNGVLAEATGKDQDTVRQSHTRLSSGCNSLHSRCSVSAHHDHCVEYVPLHWLTSCSAACRSSTTSIATSISIPKKRWSTALSIA